MGGHKRPFPSFYQRLFPGNAFSSLQPITYSICFASTANAMLRKCLLPHCLDFRLMMGLLFGAFAKDLVPLCLSHCQPHSRAQLWYPHSSQTLGFLLASEKFKQSYLMHSLSASQGRAIYFFPLYFFAFLSLLLLQAFSNWPLPASGLSSSGPSSPPLPELSLESTHISVLTSFWYKILSVPPYHQQGEV